MKSGKLKLGMIGLSTKENEKRAAIHPAHFENFDAETRKQVFVEKGYGTHFRFSDQKIAPHVAGLMERKALFDFCDVMMIFKPTEKDFSFFHEGQTLWGAVHTVQNENIVELAIDKKMTFVAMEDMNIWHGDRKGEWIFNTQSEFAGYCSVHHAMTLTGTKGWHDQPKKAAVISFGGAGRGAVHGLQALEIDDITVYTGRQPIEVRATIPRVKYRQYVRDPRNAADTLAVQDDGRKTPFGQELSQHDIVVNCVLQDTDRPLMFVRDGQVELFKDGSVFIDVSCDRGMGFEFARPTTFDEPLLEIQDRIIYYCVDHSPSYLHNTASLEHSKAAWPYVKDIVAGRAVWRENPTIEKAIEIEDGTIKFRKILTFQNREEAYPHHKRGQGQ